MKVSEENILARKKMWWLLCRDVDHQQGAAQRKQAKDLAQTRMACEGYAWPPSLSCNDHTNTRHETLYEITIEGLVHNLHTILSKTCSVIMLPSSGGPGLCLVLSLLLVLIIVHSHAINLSYMKHLAVVNIQITPLINLYTFNPLWGGCNIKCFQLRAALLR